MSVIAFIQARTGSTRLPRKVLLPILDKTILWWDMYRIHKSRLLDNVVIVTTQNPQDNAIVDLCIAEKWSYFRGSEHDLLDRYYQAAYQFGAEHIVRITSDCPLIDSRIIDYVIGTYLSSAPQPDYASNVQLRSYPRGQDIEIFSFEALRRAWQNDKNMAWREHVTPYIYNHPDQFTLHNISNPVDYSNHRWTVDTPEDLELIKRVYTHFGHGDFHWQDVLALLDQHPEWVQINQHIEQKKL